MKNPKHYEQYLVEDKNITAEQQPLALGTPFFYSYHFLLEYLTALAKLDYPKKLLHLYFPVQGEDDTYATLNDLKGSFERQYASVNIVKRPEIQSGKNYFHSIHLNVCDQREWIKTQSKPLDVLFIGHDNFPPPNTITRLLEAKQLGANIAGGVYPFFQEGMGLTSFFPPLNRRDHGLYAKNQQLYFPTCLVGRRAWTRTCGMDSTLVKREVLDKINFHIRDDALNASDDVVFCDDACQLGFKVMTDYGVFVKHWGFGFQFLEKHGNGWTHVLATMEYALYKRRTLLKKWRLQNMPECPPA